MLYQILAFTIHGKKIKKSNKNNKYKISAPTQNEEFELPERIYSTLDIQDFFEYIVDSSIWIYLIKVENRITFKLNKYSILSRTYNA